MFQFAPLMIPFIISASLLLAVLGYGLLQLQRSFNRTTAAFVALVVSALIWTVTRTLQWLFTDELLTLLWQSLLYVGYGGTTLSVFFFAMAFTGRKTWLSWQRIALVVAPATAAFGLATTNAAGYHTLLWTGEFSTIAGLHVLDREFQLLFYLYLLYVLGFLFSGIVALVRTAVGSPKIYWRQTLAFVVGSVTPVVLGIAYVVRVTPGIPDFVDLTPVGFTVTALCYGYAIFRYQMLDLVPVARDTVIESMREGYIVLDEENRIVDLNSAAHQALSPDQKAIGTKIEGALPACADLVADHDHGTQTESELELDIDGQRRFFVATVSSLYDDDHLIGRLLLIRDVTDRRSVQKRYQALIENSSDLITVVDRNGTVTYVSPSVRRIIGVDPEFATGQDAFEFIHEDDQSVVRDAFEELIDNPGEKRRVEYRLIGGDGEWLYMESEIWNLLDNPFVEGIVTNAREITARKEREQEIEATNEELKATNEKLEQFAGVISHDLRNPINVARGHAELAKETGDEENFEKIEQSLERMESIIDDVLTLARQGEEIGDTRSVKLEAVVRDAWEHVDTKQATIEVEDRGLEADRDRLLQLLENCVRNAIEHGGEGVTVQVGPLPDGFYIEDDGPGIPDDLREEVFESGTTTNAGGTGLGLSIVGQIASAHDWSVTATESESGGARFEFTGIECLGRAD
ncbi:histidine kinase N-terminal 7TM domain-containing protein [Halovenus sp. HT40]|uniref:histidine kinase N-terminal 7TM domain-containing protein n=1 Tax=Halovenus sp. HT40 TaxID=3126691 RepID=UPI00300E8EE0